MKIKADYSKVGSVQIDMVGRLFYQPYPQTKIKKFGQG